MGQGSCDPVGDAEARAACERILASPAFAKAHLMGRLLRYLVAQALSGNVRGTTEYAIGLEVFGRKPASYSPGEDPTVRVQVGRLRQRLEACQAEGGAVGEVVFRIPLGGYMPVIERRGEPRCLPAPPCGPAGALALDPVHVIAGSRAGEAFARGLQEELVNQLVHAFGPVVVAHAAGDPAPRVVVSTLRIDADRIRVSVRLQETPPQRVTWARQFDHAPRFSIQEQEALATTICSALKLHLQA